MAPDADRPVFIFSEQSLKEVHVAVEGEIDALGQYAALKEARWLRGARTLGDLDTRLRRTSQVLALDGRDDLALEVAPAPEHGAVQVVIRPAPGALRCLAGLDSRGDAVGRFATEGTPASLGGRLRLAGALSVWPCGALGASLRFSPTQYRLKVAEQALAPTFEIATRATDAWGSPSHWRQLGLLAASVVTPNGQHTARLETVLLKDNSSSLGTTLGEPASRATLGYRFADAWHQGETTGAPGGHRSASAELTTTLTNCADNGNFARIGAAWSRTWPLLGTVGGGPFWTLSMGGCFLVPFGERPQVGAQDRLFLGGASSGITQCVPGYKNGGICPEVARNQFRKPQDPETPASKQKLRPFSGGEARVCAASTILCPLPCQKIGWAQPHALCFGAIGGLTDRARPLFSVPTSLEEVASRALRASIGAGVGVPLPGGGFAGIAWALPMWAQQADQQQRLQFWITMGPSV